MKILPSKKVDYEENVITPIRGIPEKPLRDLPRAYYEAILEAADKIGTALDEGKTPKQAEATVDGMDLTGYMMGWAIYIVCVYNPRGEALRRWWNKKHGSPDVKGVVNPAILVLEDKEATK